MPTSSPRTNTRSSFSISSQMPCRIASTYVVTLILLTAAPYRACIRSRSLWFVVDILETVFRFRKRIFFRGQNGFVDFVIDALLHIIDPGFCCETPIDEKALETGD